MPRRYTSKLPLPTRSENRLENPESLARHHYPSTHDVNNKLGVILARCELLSLRPQLDSKSSADLREIRNAAEALAHMMRAFDADSSESATSPDTGSQP
jgi:hypothetical protein